MHAGRGGGLSGQVGESNMITTTGLEYKHNSIVTEPSVS